MTRPMYYEQRPELPITAPTGNQVQCCTWDAEAALRMLMNNVNQNVAGRDG